MCKVSKYCRFSFKILETIFRNYELFNRYIQTAVDHEQHK